jgi:hypothetical protein
MNRIKSSNPVAAERNPKTSKLGEGSSHLPRFFKRATRPRISGGSPQTALQREWIQNECVLNVECELEFHRSDAGQKVNTCLTIASQYSLTILKYVNFAMGRVLESISEKEEKFIRKQKVFFVATAALSGEHHVNVSPKAPGTSVIVIDPHTVAYARFYVSTELPRSSSKKRFQPPYGTGSPMKSHLAMVSDAYISFMCIAFRPAVGTHFQS